MGKLIASLNLKLWEMEAVLASIVDCDTRSFQTRWCSNVAAKLLCLPSPKFASSTSER